MTVEGLLGLGGLLVAVLTAAFVFIPAMRKARTDSTVAEVDVDDKIAARRLVELNRLYERVETLEASDEENHKKINALGRVITTLAEQWPKGADAPVFDDADLAELADTLPAKWRKHAPRPRTT